jgi:ABC-2 type transport system ATP-binding protein
MIQIDNLNFSYSKKTSLIEKFDLQLEAGKIYGLLGKNGTGKSTILKLLVGLHFPKGGNITMNAQGLSETLQPGHRPVVLLQDIFFLPEQFQSPPVTTSTFVNMESPFYPRFDHPLLHTLLKEFELPVNTPLHKLSYGQQKKFMIAFGLACQTRYLFMDEPTNGLDIPSKVQYRKVIASNLSKDQVVIISTHQIRDLDKLLDSIIVLDQGKVLFKSDIEEIEKKISFIKDWKKPNSDDVLYTEHALGGYISLIPNKEEISSDVELEILFNAILHNNEGITQLFK